MSAELTREETNNGPEDLLLNSCRQKKKSRYGISIYILAVASKKEGRGGGGQVPLQRQ